MTGATCGAGNAHSYRNAWFYSRWGVHDFTHSLYIHVHYIHYNVHYILINLSVFGNNVYILMTGLFAVCLD